MCLLVLPLLGCQKKITVSEQLALDAWIEQVSPLLRSGDLVFRRGTGLAGRMVTMAGGADEIYSHIGIVTVAVDSSGWMVCHAVPSETDLVGDEDRLRCEPLGSFFSSARSSRGKVMRVSCSDSLAAVAAADAILKWREGVLFDHDYEWADTTSLYCTQLVALVYSKQGIDLVEDRNHPTQIPGFKGIYIFPSDIEQSALLERISYY